MIRALILSVSVLSFSAIAACSMMGTPTSPPAHTGGGQADACGLAQHQNLIGMDESAIDQSSLPAHHRIICMGCMATMEYVADRLTIQMGPGHKVASIRCG